MLAAGKAKKPGKRGRKPAKIDLKAKLERSRQSARECRARKKLRYQYLEELVSSKERAICALREELDMVSVRKRPPDLLADVALFFLLAVQAVVLSHGPGQDPRGDPSSADGRRPAPRSRHGGERHQNAQERQDPKQRLTSGRRPPSIPPPEIRRW